MERRRRARRDDRGGERIPSLRPAHTASLIAAAAAVACAVALGALVATDAGSSAKLAWAGAGVTAVLLAVGRVARSSAPVHAAIALLGAILLLRHQDRLLLAPVYGAGLLLVEELAWRSIEWAGARAIGPGVLGARVGATLATVALGACVAALAAIAATAAVGRSVALTALAAVAVVAAFGGIARYARHACGASGGSGDRSARNRRGG